MKLAGWGRFPVRDCQVRFARTDRDVLASINEGSLIPRGNGRAYGDSALNTGLTLDMRKFNRMLAFDEATGMLVAEAGTLLGDIIATFLPRGWFPFVTPGTKFVTLGGMVAADVHGKNHHADGAFGRFIDWFDLACADGTIRRCSRTENCELFEWTIGGMGLTGVVLRVALRLRPVESAWIRQSTIPAPDLDAAVNAFEGAMDASYSVAWIDSLATGSRLGRSLVFLGEHGKRDELPETYRSNPYRTRKARLPRSIPIDLPRGLLNRFSVSLFNQLYYANGKRQAGDRWVDWDSYFYPLDAILGWNRIYGSRGFVQFQCALPLASAKDGLKVLLQSISSSGSGSFLAVLKRFGAQGDGLSFPMPGYTLALDFAVSESTLGLLGRLDDITIAHGGRFYLAKDARMSAEALDRADGRVAQFRRMRADSAMSAKFHSVQSERLGL